MVDEEGSTLLAVVGLVEESEPAVFATVEILRVLLHPVDQRIRFIIIIDFLLF